MIEGHGDDVYRYAGIRMNFSSNIYGHADLSGLERHLCRHISCIRSYPEPSAHSLEGVIAREYGVEPGNVMATSGAVDAIWLVAQALRRCGSFKVMGPTFSEYEDACLAFGYQYAADAAVCWICNPNNPTGHVYDDDCVVELAKKHRWLVADMSYEDYTLWPMMTAREALQYGNMVQIRSMTKRYAVPGLRLGFIIAHEDVVAKLRKAYRPWAVNSMAIEAGKWLIGHGDMAVDNLKQYLQEAQRLRRNLMEIPGIAVMETQTNFMLCTVEKRTAAMLKDYLARSHGILIRDASNIKGLTQHHFRVAAQKPEENDALVEAIKIFMEDNRHGG